MASVSCILSVPDAFAVGAALGQLEVCAFSHICMARLSRASFEGLAKPALQAEKYMDSRLAVFFFFLPWDYLTSQEIILFELSSRAN